MTAKQIPLFAADASVSGAVTQIDRPNVYGLEEHSETIARIYTGEITAVELKARARRFWESETVVAELYKLTVQQLKRKVMNPYGKKADLVDRVRRNMAMDYLVPNSTSGYASLSFIPMQETYEDAFFRAVEKITDEGIEACAARRKARLEQVQKAFTYPETLDEFEMFLRQKTEDDLSDGQLARYDALVYEHERKNAERIAEQTNTLEVVEIPESTTLYVEEGFHTKKECPIWLVKLSERVEKDVYRELANTARKFGARWSRYSGGFLFYNPDDANAFVALSEGEEVDLAERKARLEEMKRERAADRLEAYAGRHLDNGQMKLNQDRLANTLRRARMAAGVEADARREIAFSKTVAAVANALKENQIDVLAKVRYASDLATLDAIMSRATGKACDMEAGGTVDYWERRPAKVEDVRYAGFPYPYVTVAGAEQVRDQLKGRRGMKQVWRVLDQYIESARAKGNGFFVVEGETYADMILEKLSSVRGSSYEVERFKEAFLSYRRLKRMGLINLNILRHALREVFPYLTVPEKADELTTRLRELIGLKIPGFFPTPTRVVEKMLAGWLTRDVVEGLDRPFLVLEPSAGSGNIADVARSNHPDVEVHCVEINYRLREILKLKGHNLVADDFLEYRPGPVYDAVVMNPPFEDDLDMEHVYHAWSCLKPGGVLFAIMSPTPFFGSARRYEEFREWYEPYLASIETLENGTFKESGTNVASKVITLQKPLEDERGN